MSAIMSEVLDLKEHLEDEKKDAFITIRVPGEVKEAAIEEAKRLGLYKSRFNEGVSELCRRILLNHFLSQGVPRAPLDHPAVEHFHEAARLAAEHYADDLQFDPVEQREITQAAVKAHHALYSEEA